MFPRLLCVILSYGYLPDLSNGWDIEVLFMGREHLMLAREGQYTCFPLFCGPSYSYQRRDRDRRQKTFENIFSIYFDL